METLSSLKSFTDPLLFTMNYVGDYDAQLRKNLYEAIGKSISEPRGCTTFAAGGVPGKAILARNHDYFVASPALVLFTSPTDGYKSVSIVDLSILSVAIEPKSGAIPEEFRTMLLYAPFLPFDGMNEFGLAVGTMYAPKAELAKYSRKPTIISLEAIRYMLDHARTVKEVIDLLGTFNIDFPVMPCHFLIADLSGKSVVVEFIEGKMRLLENSLGWQVSTNFQLFGSEKEIAKRIPEFQKSNTVRSDLNGKSYWRYLTASNELESRKGVVDPDEAMAILRSVGLAKKSQDVWMTTQWSAVYDLGSRSLRVATNRMYDAVRSFSLGAK